MNSDMEKTAIPILDKRLFFLFLKKVPCNQKHSCDMEQLFQNICIQTLSSISGSLSDICYGGKYHLFLEPEEK